MAYKNPFADQANRDEYYATITPAPVAKKETGWDATKRIAGDSVAGFGSGAGQLVRSIGTFGGGSDSAVAQIGQDAVDYWDKEKSAKLRAAEQDLAADMENKDVSAWDVTKKMVTSPTLLANAIASSAPAMAAGMGLGGIVARSMAGAGVMVDAAGGLTRAGSAFASGVGEGAIIGADVYENTKGNGIASAGGLAMGVITSLVTPGNVGAAAARRMAGTSDDAVRTAFNGTVGARVGGAVAAEAGQEYGQEFSQKLIEQAGRGETLDFNAAAKAGAVGAVVGGVMGGGMHPIVGDGAPRYATQADKDIAVAAEVAAVRLGSINKALEADPNNPVLLAEASLAQATINVAVAQPAQRDVTVAQQTAAAAQLEAARNPGDRDLSEQAAHATAAALQITAGPEGVAPAIDLAVNAAAETIHAAPDIDSAIGGFAAQQDASAQRVVTAGIQNTHAGVGAAENEVLASHTATAEQLDQFEREALAEQQKQEQHALKVEQQTIKNQTAAVKLQQEIAKAEGEEITIEAPATGADELWDMADQESAALNTQPGERMLTGDQVREFMIEPAPQSIVDADTGDNSAMVRKSGEQMRLAGYSQAVIEQGLTLPPSALLMRMNSVEADPARRRQAFYILRSQGINTGLNPAQFEARNDEFERRIAEALPATPSGDRRQLSGNLASRPLESLAHVAAGRDDSSTLARVALAFRTGDHLGNVDARIAEHRPTGSNLLSTPTPAPVREPVTQASPDDRYIVQYHPDGRTADVVDQSGEVFDTYRGPAAEQDAEATAQRLNARPASAPAPRTRAQALADEIRAAAADEDGTAPASERAVRSAPAARTNTIQSDFRSRARAALANHSLQKLGEFWKTVMKGRGQRVLNVRTSDLANRATSLSSIDQADLNTLRDRYNRELKRQARLWAEANNQPAPSTQNPVISITNVGGRGIAIKVRPLGRNSQNPYAVPPGNVQTGSASMDPYDNHMTTTGLESAPGSSNLAYRLGGEVARIAGGTVPASGTLLTNNPMRRQMQSVFSDTVFAPGHVSPVSAGGNTTPQGVPSDVWSDAGQVERIGLNALRAAHSASENRRDSGTAAKFIENLMFNSDGQIYAATAPRHYHGFPQGTVVSDNELIQKLLETGAANGRDYNGPAITSGVGIDTAKFAIMTNTVMAAIEGDRNARVPAWMVTKAKQIGRDMGGWMFSEGEQVNGTPITRDEATARVNDLLGDNVAKLMLESGMIEFVDTASELTGETFSDANGNVRGATAPDGSIVMVLENLTAENFDAVLQHEGLHSTLKNLVGEETYNKLMDRLDTLLKSGKGADWAAKAEAAVPANTDPAHRLEEVAAYAAQQAAMDGKSSNPLVQWAKDFMSALRAGIIKSKRVPEALRVWAIKNLQAQDLQRLALAGLRSQASAAQGGTKLSGLFTNTPAFKKWFGDSKFERDSRLSVEEEVKVSTDPLEQPHPQELNIVGLNWRKPFERAVEMIRTSIQDKHVTLRRIQQIAGVTAERIKIDTISALDRLGSRLMTKQHDLVKAPLAKIEHLLTTAGYSSEEGRIAIDDYLKYMHVAEYNAHIATINPARYEMRDGVRTYVSGYDTAHPGSGITDQEAQAHIDAVNAAAKRGGREAAVLEANEVYRQMIKDLQNYAVEMGLEKQATIDVWNDKFPNYTPFNRDLDLDENLSIGTVPGSQGFSLRTGIARRAMGSAADIVSPLASTMLFGLKTTTRGENAVVSRTVLNFAREFIPNYLSSEKGPDGQRLWKPMWKVETVPNQRVVKKVNVYRTKMADGEMSPEFYNREQARDYADYQQSIWEEMNLGADPQTSGIRVQQVGNEPQNRVLVQPVPNPNNQANVMVIPEGGENKIITFDKHSEDAMAILHGLKGTATSGENAKTMARWLTVPRMFSRWVMATSTVFSPVFSLFNAARDVLGAVLSIGSDKIPGWTAKDSAAITKNFFSAAGSIWKQKGAEFRALHSNTGAASAPAAGSYAAWAEEMQAYGGATGVRESAADIDEAETQIRRLFGQELIEKTTSPNKAHDWLSKTGGFVVKMGDAFARFGEGETKVMGIGWVSRNVVSATARLNEAAELATRTAVFKAATEKFIAAGHSETEAKTMAANISKNVSTNFNRRGTASSTINQLFPFFNAAMQGSARLAESLFEKQTYTVTKEGRVAVDQKTKLTAYGKVILGSLAGIGGLQAALLAMAGFEDDDIQKNIKDRAFIIPLGGDGSYVAIPMPHGFNTIVNFGREMADAVIHPEKATSHIANALWQAPAFNPLGGAGNVVTDFLPAIADTPVSLYMNQDAFGRPIAKEDGDKANPTPGFTRAKEGASKTGRMLAEALNTISGGNEDQKGAISPTPDQIDFALGTIGGGVGRELSKAGALLGAGVNDMLGVEREEIPTHKLPLIGRIYGDTGEPVAQRSKAFEIRKDLNNKYARYKGLRDRGEVDAANSFWDENPELALRDDFERFSKNDSKQKKAQAIARNNEEVGEVNRITGEQDSKVSDLVARYKELKAK